MAQKATRKQKAKKAERKGEKLKENKKVERKEKKGRVVGEEKHLIVIRVGGTVNVRKEINDTLKMLRLHKPHHAVIVKNTPSIIGMIRKVKDYVAYGEIDGETLVKLLNKRGRLSGNRRLTEEYLKQNTQFGSIEELAKALMNFEVELKDLNEVKPVFRLRPPRKGYNGIKKPKTLGGTLGYWPDINELVKRMI